MKRSRSESNDAAKMTATSEANKRLTYVELYCGVGGWTMALEEAIQAVDPSVSLACAAALDHSHLCMSVYDHNHQHHLESSVMLPPPDSVKQYKKKGKGKPAVRIQDLTAEQVIAWQADIWMMSPPCQPHSRQHDNQEKDLQDPRSQSFLHVCQLLQQLPEESLPQLVLLENVVGFESSNSCWRWRNVLAERNYRVGHFHLEPTQVGLPNDRPRYFCIAVREKRGGAADKEESKANISPSLSSLGGYLQQETLACADASQRTTAPLDPEILHDDLKELQVAPPKDQDAQPLPTITELLTATLLKEESSSDDLKIPDKILNSSAAWCMDIVTPNDRRSACFTSSYGKFIRGTGSILYTGDTNNTNFALVDPKDREFDPHWADGLNLKMNLRYFSGQEMAQLFGFSSRFAFPTHITRKQQWKLVGNSLNVRVAARLIEMGLRVIWKIPVPSGK
jgi:tRNA (cytosine38-C5)-methyltransferase